MHGIGKVPASASNSYGSHLPCWLPAYSGGLTPSFISALAGR
jgi:hypothetical protein